MDRRAIENYVVRAQKILKQKSDFPIGHLLQAIEEMKRYMPDTNIGNHIPWNNVVHWAEEIKSLTVRLELTKLSSYHLEAPN